MTFRKKKTIYSGNCKIVKFWSVDVFKRVVTRSLLKMRRGKLWLDCKLEWFMFRMFKKIKPSSNIFEIYFSRKLLKITIEAT